MPRPGRANGSRWIGNGCAASASASPALPVVQVKTRTPVPALVQPPRQLVVVDVGAAHARREILREEGDRERRLRTRLASVAGGSRARPGGALPL